MTEFCLNHIPVPCRELEFLMTEDPLIPGNTIRASNSGGRSGAFQIVTGYLDGLGCPACGSFEPTEKPHA